MMTQKVKKLLLKIATENAKELYTGAEGLWVSNDQLFSDFDEDEYEKFLGPERFEEIQSGQVLTEAEILELREKRLENWLSDDADADVVPGYCLVEVTTKNGYRGIALILCTGYSFSELRISAEEIFDTREVAMAYLKENGSTSWY